MAGSLTLDEAREMIRAYAERSRDQDAPARVPSERETMAACIVLDAILTSEDSTRRSDG